MASEFQSQYFVKRNYQPAFTQDTMPRLLYVSRRLLSDQTRPRLLHAHPSFVELLLVEEGSARFLIGDTAYDVQAGDLLVFNSGVVHDELSDTPFGSCCIAVGGLRLDGLRENALVPDDIPPVFHAGEELDDLRALYDIMYRSLAADRPDCEVFCHRLMLALLDRALTLSGSEALTVPPVEAEPASLGRQVQDYIDEHFRESLTLQDLGKALHASPYYLAHVFKEVSGYSPMQYLTRRRIGEAQTLLVTTELPIARIAEMVGYETQNYFNLQFSKHVGMPPRKFRQSLQGTQPPEL
jgi:AraC-like DNA-binding protein